MLEVVFERVERRDRLRRIASQLTKELKATSSPRSGEFLDWLNAIVERAERASSVEGLEVLFEAEHVFGPDDDKGFYPSRYGWKPKADRHTMRLIASPHDLRMSARIHSEVWV